MPSIHHKRSAVTLALSVGAGLLLFTAAGCGKSEEARNLDNATGNAGKAVAKSRELQGEREKRLNDATAVLDGK